MATAQFGTLIRHIQQLAVGNAFQHLTDRQLLDDFAACGNDGAFTSLVERHGPMVLRVCRRVLNHEQDTEDAFQATFLVLARNFKSIRCLERHNESATIGNTLEEPVAERIDVAGSVIVATRLQSLGQQTRECHCERADLIERQVQ